MINWLINTLVCICGGMTVGAAFYAPEARLITRCWMITLGVVTVAKGFGAL
jgi:hypothetical protein